MSIWSKADFQQVRITVQGDVLAEHLELLKNYLLDRLHYGYRRIFLDMNAVRSFHPALIQLLVYIRCQFDKQGGKLSIEYRDGIIGEWN